jgi:hypothetical protein
LENKSKKKVNAKKDSSYENEEGKSNEKDNMFTIFHALGKFLYNKRVNSKTGEIEQMPAKIMKNPEKRPKLYFKHSDILN